MTDTDFKFLVGGGTIWLICIIIRCIVWIFVSIKFGEIAEIKGHSRSYGWWVYFFDIIGIIMVAILPDRNASVNVTNTVRVSIEKAQKKHSQELPKI